MSEVQKSYFAYGCTSSISRIDNLSKRDRDFIEFAKAVDYITEDQN